MRRSVNLPIAIARLLTGRAELCGSGAILDYAEIAGNAIRTDIEWVRFSRLAACGAVGFEEGIVEFGVI